MDPNAGEPGNQGGAAVADNPNPPTNPLANLEDVVVAAQQEAAAAQTPKGQFESQFGSGPATSPVTEAPVAQEQQIVENPNSTAEIASQPEDPQATFVQEIKDAVEKLEQATKEEVAA